MLLIQCVICCLLFTLVILPAQYKDPLNMIMSYPPEIIKRVEQLPQYRGVIKEREKSHISKKIVGIILCAVLLAGVAYFSGCKSFSSVFGHVFTLFFIINLYDLVVLDWGVFCHSKRLRIPGTEDMEQEYKDPWFHVRGMAVGMMLGLLVASLSACLAHIFLALL